MKFIFLLLWKLVRGFSLRTITGKFGLVIRPSINVAAVMIFFANIIGSNDVGTITYLLFAFSSFFIIQSMSFWLIKSTQIFKKYYLESNINIYVLLISTSFISFIEFLIYTLIIFIYLFYNFYDVSLDLKSIILFYIINYFFIYFMCLGISNFFVNLCFYYRDLRFLAKSYFFIFLIFSPFLGDSFVFENNLFITLLKINPLSNIIENYKSLIFDNYFDISDILISYAKIILVFLFFHIISQPFAFIRKNFLIKINY